MSTGLRDFKFAYIVNMDVFKDVNNIEFNHYVFTSMLRSTKTRDWIIPTISDQQANTMVRYFTNTKVLTSSSADKEKHTKIVDELRTDPEKCGIYKALVVPVNAGNTEELMKTLEQIYEQEAIAKAIKPNASPQEAIEHTARVKALIEERRMLKDVGFTDTALSDMLVGRVV